MRTAPRRDAANLTAESMMEALESRKMLDGVTSSLPPVPPVDLSRPVDAATLHALGDQLHTLGGDGSAETADASPWIDQWFPQEPARALTQPVIIPRSSELDLRSLDDGSGDGVTDNDIYQFNRPAPTAAAQNPAAPAAPASHAIPAPAASVLWIESRTDANAPASATINPSPVARTFIA